jgi:hypothetical protein
MGDYKLGSDDPVIEFDPGAGAWNAKTAEWDMVFEKKKLQSMALGAYLKVGNDAPDHLRHYFGNTGEDYIIDLTNMIEEVPSAKEIYDRELRQARSFVETLEPGIHFITSGSASPGYNHKAENQNWYYAVGGYRVWGKGLATVVANQQGARAYMLNFEFKFADRYNWDKGKSVNIDGRNITDDFMGEFHRQGLAKEFTMYGSITEFVSWGHVAILLPSVFPPRNFFNAPPMCTYPIDSGYGFPWSMQSYEK